MKLLIPNNFCDECACNSRGFLDYALGNPNACVQVLDLNYLKKNVSMVLVSIKLTKLSI